MATNVLTDEQFKEYTLAQQRVFDRMTFRGSKKKQLPVVQRAMLACHFAKQPLTANQVRQVIGLGHDPLLKLKGMVGIPTTNKTPVFAYHGKPVLKFGNAKKESGPLSFTLSSAGIEACRRDFEGLPEVQKIGAEIIKVIAEPIDLDEPAQKYNSTVVRRIRDTAMVRKLRDHYDKRCQIIGCEFDYDYVEGHHVQPIGRHDGPDVKSNILILCPNHHALFDYLVPEFIAPDEVVVGEDILKLRFSKNHKLNPKFTDFHNRHRIVYGT